MAVDQFGKACRVHEDVRPFPRTGGRSEDVPRQLDGTAPAIDVSVPKGRGCHSEVVSVRTLGWVQEIQAIRVPWNDCLLNPSKDRVEGHCKQKTARRIALSCSSGHGKLSTSRSCEFHMRGTVRRKFFVGSGR